MGGAIRKIGLGVAALFAVFALLHSSLAFACALETEKIARSDIERRFENAELFGLQPKEAVNRFETLTKMGDKVWTIEAGDYFASGYMKKETLVIEVIGREFKEADESERKHLKDLEALIRLQARSLGAKKIHLRVPKDDSTYQKALTWPFILFQKYPKVWESNLDTVTPRAFWYDSFHDSVNKLGAMLAGGLVTALVSMGAGYVLSVPDEHGVCRLPGGKWSIVVPQVFCLGKKPAGVLVSR